MPGYLCTFCFGNLFKIIFFCQIPFKSNQIIFIGLRSSKDYYKRSGGVVGIYEKGFMCAFFYMDGCVLREWVVRGDGLDGCFGE